MKSLYGKLSHQLLIIIIVVFVFTFLLLGFILPQVVVPITEQTIYSYLRQPLEFIESDIDQDLLTTEVAYIYQLDDAVAYSDNLGEIIRFNNIDDILNKIKNEYGKFEYRHQTYYYYTLKSDNVLKIALTNDTYIEKTKHDILNAILPVVLLTFLIIALILIIWSSIIVRKIEKLKQKIDHIDDDKDPRRIS